MAVLISAVALPNLYSSMDRLETQYVKKSGHYYEKFIFQYGQIRNAISGIANAGIGIIYIPVWIDQKPRKQYQKQ